MKIVIINGSPRIGNTFAAVKAFMDDAVRFHEIEIIEAAHLNISGCKCCGECNRTNGCSANDDTNPTVDKLVSADMIVFASPVYFYGMTAQMKLVIDKLYCKAALLSGKKAGIILIGAAPVTDQQYGLINEQFKSIAKYHEWDILFNKFYSAAGSDDLKNNYDVIREIQLIGSGIQQIADMSYVICEGPVEYYGDVIESVHITGNTAYLNSTLSKVSNGRLKWIDNSSYGECYRPMNSKYDRENLTEVMELFKDKVWHYRNVPYSEEKKQIIYKNLLG